MQWKHPISLFLVAMLLTLGLALGRSGAPTAAAQSGPRLAVASGITVQEAMSVTVPIDHLAHGTEIAAMIFSIDYDESCLALDLTDADNNGRPDSIDLNAPAGSSASVTVDPSDRDGELDFIFADYFPPFVLIPDTFPLVELTFSTRCTPPPGGSSVAHVRFSDDPEPSFGGPEGNSVIGTVQDGEITILSKTPPSPTSTSTPSATPTPIATGTPSPTASPSATGRPETPSPTPTFVPTVPARTIVEFFTATIERDGVMLSWKTNQEINTRAFTIRRYTLGQSSGFENLSGERLSKGIQGGTYTYFDNTVLDNTVLDNTVLNSTALEHARSASIDEHSADEHSANEHSANEHSANEHSANEHSANEHSANEHSANEHSANEHSADEHSANEHSVQYTYLLVEERRSGQLVPYYDLAVTTTIVAGQSSSEQIWLPLILR